MSFFLHINGFLLLSFPILNSSSQSFNVENPSAFDQTSSSTASNNFGPSRKTNLPMHSSIEVSFEYRELKRLYVHEQNQAEEGQKG